MPDDTQLGGAMARLTATIERLEQASQAVLADKQDLGGQIAALNAETAQLETLLNSATTRLDNAIGRVKTVLEFEPNS